MSRQTTSADASDSIAFSCWASAPRLAMRSAATAKVTLVRRISPSGTSVTTPATAVVTASLSGLVGLPQRVPEDGAERHHHGDHHDQEEVQSPLERRARMPEGPGHVCDLLGVAGLADRRHRVEPRALGRERAGTHLVPGKPGHGLRLPGEDRLVQREPVRLVENAVRDELVAGLDSDQVAGHDLFHLDRAGVAFPHDRRVGRDEGCEPVERLLRAPLLEDPDSGVRNEDPDEERVLPVAEREREDAERDEDEVEDREDVRPDDARHRPARRRRLDWASFLDQPGRFGLGKALERPTRRRWDPRLGHERHASKAGGRARG